MSIEFTLLSGLVDKLLLDESNSYKKLMSMRKQSFKRSTSYKKKNKDKQHQCPICEESYSIKQFPKTCLCEHHPFCQTCSEHLIKMKIMQRELITCELKNCDALLDEQSIIFKNLEPGLKQIYHDINRTVVNSQINCRKSNCNGYFSVNNLQCDICKTIYCQNCYQPQHEQNCFMNNLLFNQDIKKCPSCNIMIVKQQGCNHITCVCTYEFCYVCSKKWNKTHHFCSSDKKGCSCWMPSLIITLVFLVLISIWIVLF